MTKRISIFFFFNITQLILTSLGSQNLWFQTPKLSKLCDVTLQLIVYGFENNDEINIIKISENTRNLLLQLQSCQYLKYLYFDISFLSEIDDKNKEEMAIWKNKTNQNILNIFVCFDKINEKQRQHYFPKCKVNNIIGQSMENLITQTPFLSKYEQSQHQKLHRITDIFNRIN